MKNLLKQFNLAEYIQQLPEIGNFTLKFITLQPIDERDAKEKTITAIQLKREKESISTVEKCRGIYDNKILHYPSANKLIKQIKPKHKIKIIQIAL